MQKTALLQGKHEVNPSNIKEALQQATEIEIATIPVYLYTYYSINRVPDQTSIQNELEAMLLKKGMTQQDAEEKALALSARIMVISNKAGALILSVVIEEMLHMSLASNVKQALVGDPELVGKSPSVWPAYLPGHEPPFPINRSKLSLDQLYTFLQIESPKPLLGKDDKPTALPYVTIGEFYQLIEDCITRDFSNPQCYHTDRPQLIPGRAYYAQNDIDTVYYNKYHKPKFENAADSGDLVHVVDQVSALKALETIVTQGEGSKGGNTLNPDGSVNCAGIKPGDYDDKAHEELAHFDKFNQLYCQLQALQEEFKGLFGDDFDVGQYFIYNVPDNPSTSDYPETVQKVSTLTNAVYSYLYVMTQACYRADANTQYEIFMFGIHKSMMWILGSLCSMMPSFKYIGHDGREYEAAPTFEEYTFSAASTPKAQIIQLFNEAVAVYDGVAYLKERIEDLPNVPLEGYLEKTEQALMA